eukprot:TRINITY_DN5478_c0_g1_i4.p1 TRINITY_DN5478_c0_g1~~TRINITY_DN5478_c0_g1_i4.p1  ORF type:complete len:386 (+),score=46.13 TRINITY_DN5478_c0_g1_i4:169-1326(+)
MNRRTQQQEDDYVSKLIDRYIRTIKLLTPQQVGGIIFVVLFLLMVGIQTVGSGQNRLNTYPLMVAKNKKNSASKSKFFSDVNTYSLTVIGTNSSAEVSSAATTLQIGTLVKSLNGIHKVIWDTASAPTHLRTPYPLSTGLELHGLQQYRQKLYSCDLNTGIVFELGLASRLLYPRWILAADDGDSERPFPCKWLAVRDSKLHVGSHGRDWVDSTDAIHYDHQWIKVLTTEVGRPRSILWDSEYRVVKSTFSSAPGYMMHEAVQWSEVHHQWVFLPYRVSSKAFDSSSWEDNDGGLLLVRCDGSFIHCSSTVVKSAVKPNYGFSEFKFLPNGKDDTIIAVRSCEKVQGNTPASYLTIFDLKGEILMKDTPIPGNVKFEGLIVGERG